MPPDPVRPATRPTYAWWAVLCLVGLDYFSSLAYLPSIAYEFVRELAPFAGLGVAAVTLFAALPVYLYVVGRSFRGEGAVGLLERRLHGWRGKLFILAILGFIATDFVLTRSLSVSDAATHLLANPIYQGHSQWVMAHKEAVRAWLPPLLAGSFFDFWSEQLLLTLGLSMLAFGLYFYLLRNLTRGFVGLAVGVVGVYLLLNLIVLASGLGYLARHPTLVTDWEGLVRSEIGDYRTETRSAVLMALLLGLLAFPPMAIGLSGFELTLGVAPMVRGASADRPDAPHGRILRTRLLMIVAAVLMCVYVLAATLVVPLLVPLEMLLTPTGMEHRSLSYLAHGGMLSTGQPAAVLNPLFGVTFGTVYDLSTILILCLAGATATISLQHLVPEFLGRFGMQMEWAQRVGLIMHLFNGTILLVALVFRASVTAQMWAYAASVVALLFAASTAALLDVRAVWWGHRLRRVVQLPFLLTMLLFLAIGGLVVVQQPSGVAIALLFVLVVLITAIGSRWRRSTELRFDGFEFHDEDSRQRWERISRLDFQVLVPHDPTGDTLIRKEQEIRGRHRLGVEVPIVFVEVALGDPSEFYSRPVLQVAHETGREIIRLQGCASIAHVVAAIGLAFREVGQPPEIHFAWSDESPLAANLNFLLLGQGNVPWMVHALLRHAEPNPVRRPRVVIG